MQDITGGGQVLGISDFGPVGGTPLIPPSYLTLYFTIFIFLLISLYIYFYRKKRPVLWRYRLRLLAILAIAINVVVFGGGSLLAGYWLIPTPGIRRTIPEENYQTASPTNKIEIVFDRPIDRSDLEKSISPDTPGNWVFENSLYTTHLYRNLVFYPYYSLHPDTTYTIKLSGVRNLIKISKPYNLEFSFKTQASPTVSEVAPSSGETNVNINSEIRVVLDNPNENLSQFNFRLEPAVDFNVSLDPTKKVYTLRPVNSLVQGTKYDLRTQKSDVILNLQDGSVVERGETTYVHDTSFVTLEAPEIKSFKPLESKALTNSDIVIGFSKEMNKTSVRDNFSIEPNVAGTYSWEDNSTLKFNPLALSYDTEYKITIRKGTISLDEGFLEADLVKTFKTIGAVKISNITPENNWSGVNIMTPIKISFDQEVDHESAQSKFAITPLVDGNFSWEADAMTFTPEKPFQVNTSYNVSISKGIKSINGVDSQEDFKSAFTTQEGTTKLAVPAYLQKYSLSCEIASLRMALNYRGLGLSEDDIIPKVGFDKTPHSGNVWGNPNVAFVGNISGRQMVDGYGVHWTPIAKAARTYREAQEFEGWSIEQLTREIQNGNPVVIWVYSHFGTPTSWNTPDGTHIYAVRDEHAVTVAGFVGSPQNPTQIIVNDPLSGQVYWGRASFDKKWNIFGRSGVVVR